MLIREMSREECLRTLAAARLAKLACAHENQPYIVPVYLAYREPSIGQPCLYGFTTLGQKVLWMRANPLVCVEVDEVVNYDQWITVIATGRYEELPPTPPSDSAPGRLPEQANNRPNEIDEQQRENPAWQTLSTHPMWQEPGTTAWAARPHHNSTEPLIPIYYRIKIDHVTGHQATQDATNLISPAAV
jgi:nitroimidazol reductase NimA-like FMN-containing flavoprotein (pyridoxamine 5'-phosphate oxidase superfamily)